MAKDTTSALLILIELTNLKREKVVFTPLLRNDSFGGAFTKYTKKMWKQIGALKRK